MLHGRYKKVTTPVIQSKSIYNPTLGTIFWKNKNICVPKHPLSCFFFPDSQGGSQGVSDFSVVFFCFLLRLDSAVMPQPQSFRVLERPKSCWFLCICLQFLLACVFVLGGLWGLRVVLNSVCQGVCFFCGFVSFW